MMETKVKQNNYITILGWMISNLKLKGNALLIYAIIYGFSQVEGVLYNGSRQYLADWTNSTTQGVSKCLKKLIEKGLIEKKETLKNGVKFCEYKAIVPELLPVNKVDGVETKFTGVGNKVDGGRKQSLHNNIDNTIEDIIVNNIYSAFDAKKAFESFWEIYPRKINKKKAEEKFLKICKDEETFNKIIDAVKVQTKTEQWKDVQYIPHPTTWLNGERWNDEVNVKNKNYSNIGEVLG